MKQIKHLLSLVLFVLLCTAFTACKSTSAVLTTTPPPPTTDTTTTKVVVVTKHDTVFKTEKDSSYYKAYIECRDGKPVLKPQESKKGKHVDAPQVDLKDGQLNVNCKVEAQELFAQWKDTYIKEHQQIVKRIPYAVATPLTWWQQTRMKAGSIFLSLLALACIVGGLRLLKDI